MSPDSVINNLPVRAFFLPIAAILVLLSSCSPPSNSTADVMVSPAPLSLTWEVIDNTSNPDYFQSELVLTNASNDTLTHEGWALYFNFIRLIDTQSTPGTVQITHLNGDFYQLEPTTSFPTLGPGEQTRVAFSAAAWAIKVSDAPSGFYLVMEDASSEKIIPVTDFSVLPFTKQVQTNRSTADVLPVPTPESIYESNRRIQPLAEDEVPPILPSPARLELTGENVSISPDFAIHFAPGLDSEATFLANAFEADLNLSLPAIESEELGSTVITLLEGDFSLPEGIEGVLHEAYHLRVSTENGIVIQGATRAGVFYGIQSLRALIDPAGYAAPTPSVEIPTLTIQDAPRFSYRGMHLDVSRNFQTTESVMKVLELMAFYKLNTFHFHLTDDEGWRLEIPDLPELTQVGGRRGHTLDEQEYLYPSHGSGPFPDEFPGSGYYTRSEFIDILRYATQRHIEVIPEIDLPGHARAAIKAMEVRYDRMMQEGNEQEALRYLLTHPDDASEYQSVQFWNDNVVDACQASTYAFIEKVLDELVTMYQEAGAPLTTIHTGGDEVPHGVWEGSPACQALGDENLHDYFLETVYAMLQERGLILAGWEETAMTEERSQGSIVKKPNPKFASANFQPNVWNNVWGWGMEDMAYTLANSGYKVVLSNATNLYFDLAYDKDPLEPGFYWASFVDTYKAFSFIPLDLYKTAEVDINGAPIDRKARYGSHERLTESGKANILGLQGQLWSENAKSRELMEYLIFPKLLGLAERAWAQQPEWATIEDDAIREAQLSIAWSQFTHVLGHRELPRLDYLHGGVAYRIPPPGAFVQDNSVYANTTFPGLVIRYTLNGEDPTEDDAIYEAPIPFEAPVKLRTFSPGGNMSRVSSLIPAN